MKFWQKSLGVFSLGHENVELVVREETGGEFYFMPDEKSPARIKIGLDEEKWSDVVAVLLHETFEFAVTRAGRRFEPCRKGSRDMGAFTFVFDHAEFSQLCWEQAQFVTDVLPRLAEEHRKRRKAKGK